MSEWKFLDKAEVDTWSAVSLAVVKPSRIHCSSLRATLTASAQLTVEQEGPGSAMSASLRSEWSSLIGPDFSRYCALIGGLY